MTEEEAKELVLGDVSRETANRLDIYIAALIREAPRQNLISASTLDQIWSRHLLDSSQLLAIAPKQGRWIDIGSGAGLPGLVVAALTNREVILVEPRARRCAFLQAAAERMGIADRVQVVQSRAETAPLFEAAVISARAVASLTDLFAMGHRFSTPETVWVLPKGRRAAEELASVSPLWHANLQLVPSLTDSEASIVVATDVRPRKRR